MAIKSKLTGLGLRAELAVQEAGTVANNLTAAGTNQGTAYVMSLADVHIFTTVAAGTGCIFAAGSYSQGDEVIVTNYGANALLVYPSSGGAIENGSTNAAYSIAPNISVIYKNVDGLNWIAFPAASSGGAVGANPTATAGPVAVNGSAPTFMRSDAAPAVQKGSASQFGIVEVDGTTITASVGVISAVIPSNQKVAGIAFIIDGNGSAITTGTKGYLQIPFACTITEATQLADQSGSIVTNIWKCTYSQFDAGSTHPVVGDKITASAPPTISSATKSDDSTLSGWTTSISAGDILAYHVDSVTSVTRNTVTLWVTKT